jgi:alpha-D-ribose 1-methylphosphonate 5-triphosphate synthase subunit PhnH
MTMNNPALASTSVWDPTIPQVAFRQLAQVFSRPGTIHALSHAALPLVPATLLDAATSLSDAQSLLEKPDRDRLGTVLTTPENAHFVLARADIAPDFTPALGTLESPEQGATLLLVVQSLREGQALTLTGPGIQGQREIRLRGMDVRWLKAREDWNGAFPLGIDMLLLAGNEVMALPRTTLIKGVESWVM